MPTLRLESVGFCEDFSCWLQATFMNLISLKKLILSFVWRKRKDLNFSFLPFSLVVTSWRYLKSGREVFDSLSLSGDTVALLLRRNWTIWLPFGVGWRLPAALRVSQMFRSFFPIKRVFLLWICLRDLRGFSLLWAHAISGILGSSHWYLRHL